MKHINDNFKDFRDATKKALTHKLREHPVISEYLSSIQTMQSKIDKFKEIKDLDINESLDEEVILDSEGELSE